MKLSMVKDGHLGGYIQGGDPGTWCPHLWNWLVDQFSVQSVLDVGCGEGHSTRYFRDLGCDALGIDGCAQAVAENVVPGQVWQHDLCQGPYGTEQPVDLVWSCEFLEHIDERYLSHVLQTFANARKVVAVTHAFPGQEDGHHHVNCRSSRYWIQHIESLGFTCDVQRTLAARRISLADYRGINHFARSGLVFVRSAVASASRNPWSYLWKDWRINVGFRLSRPYRQQRRRRRAERRLARRSSRKVI